MLSSPTYIDHGHGGSPVYYSSTQPINPVRPLTFFFCSSILLCKGKKINHKISSKDVLAVSSFFSYLSFHSMVFFYVSDELWIECETERSAQYRTRV